MPYFPLSQITTNLYTNGEEFVYLSNKSFFYEGDYYETSTGKYYTGKNPSNGQGIEIVKVDNSVVKTKSDNDNPPPILGGTLPSSNTLDLIDFDLQDDPNLSFYNSKVIQSYPPTPEFKRRLLPQQGISFPILGSNSYRKYYVKKVNELIYFEISKETYSKLKSKDPTIAFELFECLYFPWNIGNEPEENAKINKKIVTQIERDHKWYGFHHYFRGDFGGGSITTEDLHTDGGEFLLPNRTNYVGFYHFMSNGNPMVGKSHGEGSDIPLIQIKPTTTSIPPVTSFPSTTPQTTITPTSSPTSPSSGGGGGY